MRVKYFFDWIQISSKRRMKMEQKDEVPSNDSIESGSIDKLQGTRKAENNVTDHNLSLPLPEEATAKSFSRLVGKVVILASLCLVSALSFGALSMIASFYPKEVRKYTRKKNDVM